MIELEALLLGLEPITALAIGVGALVIAPVVGTVGTFTDKGSPVGDSISKSAHSVAKGGLIWAFDIFENTQNFFAEAAESFQDLVAEAKADIANTKRASENNTPLQVGFTS